MNFLKLPIWLLSINFLQAQSSFLNDNLSQCIPGTSKLIADPIITYASFNPVAIVPEDTFTITLGLNVEGIKEIELDNVRSWSIKGNVTNTLILKDDGTQGDLKANDKLFTLNQIVRHISLRKTIETENIGPVNITFTYKDNRKLRLMTDPGCGLRIIPDHYNIPPVKRINDSIQHSDYVLNIVTKSPILDQYEEIAKRYYRIFPDDRDFLITASTFINSNLFTAAAYIGVKNDISGLYEKRNPNQFYNETLSFGSKGRLNGFITCYGLYSGEIGRAHV